MKFYQIKTTSKADLTDFTYEYFLEQEEYSPTSRSYQDNQDWKYEITEYNIKDLINILQEIADENDYFINDRDGGYYEQAYNKHGDETYFEWVDNEEVEAKQGGFYDLIYEYKGYKSIKNFLFDYLSEEALYFTKDLKDAENKKILTVFLEQYLNWLY